MEKRVNLKALFGDFWILGKKNYYYGEKMSDFYRLASENYEAVDGYSHRIFWIVEAIAMKSDAKGYIVQWVDAHTNCPQIRMEGRPYYEAWRVVNGSTGNSDYDDEFWARYLDMPGKAIYRTKIYWIDENDVLFSKVNVWKKGKVGMANELPSEYDFPEIEGRIPVEKREFIWNSENYK